MEKKRSRSGFTLIELMTVVIIVGILAIVAIPLYKTHLNKARASEGAALLGTVLTAERVYFSEKGTYTDDPDELGVSTEGNRFFVDYTITSAGDTGFTAETSGIGVAEGITVEMTHSTTTGTADLEYTFP